MKKEPSLKEVYGKDYSVEVTINNYNEEQVAKGMIIENLTQRTGDYRELSDNVIFAKDFLTKHKDVLERLRTESGRNFDSPKGGNPHEYITANDIAEWFDKTMISQPTLMKGFSHLERF